MHNWSYPQATLGLYVHDSQTSLIEDSIANVFTRLSIGSHLKQSYVAHHRQQRTYCSSVFSPMTVSVQFSLVY